MKYPQPIWMITTPTGESLQQAINERYPVTIDNEILDSHDLDGSVEYTLAAATSGDTITITGYYSITIADNTVLIERYDPADREAHQYEQYQQQREKLPNKRRRGRSPDQYRANVIRHIRTWRQANGRWPTEQEWESTHGSGNSGQTRLQRNQRAILARWDTWDELLAHCQQLEDQGVPIGDINRNLRNQ